MVRFARLSPVACLVALLLWGCGPGATDRPVAQAGGHEARTIVLVSVDTLRADRVGFMGFENAGTPVLDRLAEKGMVFERAQTTAPLTLPAHASLMTGRSVPAHGVLNNGTFSLPAEVPTLAELLQSAGWATGAFVSSPVLSRRYGLDRGFERYDDTIPPIHATRGLVIHYPERSGVKTVDAALSWLLDKKGQQALVWVHLWEPHAPYTPPEGFREGLVDRYQGEVAAADAALGRLVAGLETLGRGNGALIVVTADHGEGLGAHGEPTHGVFLYQETMHVPLVIYGPGWEVKRGRFEEPVSLADIAPTLAVLAGQDPPEGADGLSLDAVLRRGGTLAARSGVFAESHLPAIEFSWSGLRAFVSGSTKLIDAPHPELYDLAQDPGEQDDLSLAQQGRVSAMQRDLGESVSAARELAPAAGAERSASQEELEVLRSLGYAASGKVSHSSQLVDPSRIDPKERLEFIKTHDEAIGLAQSGRTIEAIAALTRLSEIDPGNPSVLVQLGQAQILAKDYNGALDTFTRAVHVAPDFALAWYRIGMLRGHRKDLEGEEEAYRRAIELDPYSVETHKALAGVLAEQNETLAAIEVLEAARKLDPHDTAMRATLERLWAKLRK